MVKLPVGFLYLWRGMLGDGIYVLPYETNVFMWKIHEAEYFRHLIPVLDLPTFLNWDGAVYVETWAILQSRFYHTNFWSNISWNV